MKCIGIGFFANEPVLEKLDETTQCTFTLAIKERRRKQGKTTEHTVFLPFIVYAEAAELIHKHKHKGHMIYFEAIPRNENGVIFRIQDFRFLDSHEA